METYASPGPSTAFPLISTGTPAFFMIGTSPGVPRRGPHQQTAAAVAKRTGSKPVGTSGTVALGAVAGLLIAAYVAWPAGWAALAGAVLAYLGACARYPWRPCPRCGGGSTDRSGDGAYRVRRTCWVCGGERWPRPGTRVLRLLGYRPRG